ncbi:MAG: hypothetical protein RIQ60_2759 [Pseudomonadota bacterium]|jgi:tetratricopeptide (TPR) repeat protein/SAM-dependent methyltransferase
MDLALPPAAVAAPAERAFAPPSSAAAALRAALQAFHAQQPVVMEAQSLAALAAQPDSAQAQQLLGVALHLQGRNAEALPWMDRAATQQTNTSAELHINRGEVLRALQRWPEAEQAFERALVIAPGNTEALNNLGLVQQARGRFAAAEASYRAALASRPGHAEAMNNLGTLCQETRRPDEAEACYRAVLAAQPDHRNALNNLATIAKEAGRIDEARAIYEQILAATPDFWRSWNSLGQLAKDQGDYDAALACYQRSLAIAPGNADTLYNIALLELLFGDRPLRPGEPDAVAGSAPASDLLARGFAHYEVRYDGRSQNKSAPKPPELGCPMWRGESLAGKHIALVREQGLGDQLQFCRYAAALRAQGAEVTLIVDGPLVDLMGSLDGPTRVIAPGEQRDFHYDYWAFLLSLPHRLGTTLASIPAPVPYLAAPAALRERWRQRLDQLCPPGRPRIGLVWAGNPEHANNRNRSMDLAQFADLLDGLTEVAWVSLQKGGPAEELPASPWAARMPALDAELNSYADTAAVLGELDLVISVDTSVVHLAGALGRPCWALLAHGPDWRWLRHRSCSAWYPSLRLLRQPAPRDWASVVRQLCDALPRWLAQGRPADFDPADLASRLPPSLPPSLPSSIHSSLPSSIPSAPAAMTRHASTDTAVAPPSAASVSPTAVQPSQPPDPLDLAPLVHVADVAATTGGAPAPLVDLYPLDALPAALAERLRRWRLAPMARELGLDEVLLLARPSDAAQTRAASLCLLDGRLPLPQLAELLRAVARRAAADKLPLCLLIDHSQALDAAGAPLAEVLDALRASHHHYALRHDAGWWLLYPRSAVVAPDWAKRWLWLLPGDSTVNAAPSLGVPGVTAISMRRRLADSRFATRYFRGQALDVGGGRDSLAVYREFFPLLSSVLVYDMPQGDAQLLDNLPDASFDCVYSSHCLEHLRDPREALRHWLRVLKPGGHLVVNVPDEDLYEQGHWPSRFNSDHKLSFTIYKASSWSPVSVNLLDLVRELGDAAECLSLARIDDGYRHALAGQGLDQTRTPLAEAAIELVLRKPVAPLPTAAAPGATA